MRVALAAITFLAALSLITALPAQAFSDRSGIAPCKVRGFLVMAYVLPGHCPATGLSPKSPLARPYMGGKPEPDMALKPAHN